MPGKIPLFKIGWDEADVTSVNQVIRAGSHWSTGENIARFESRIRKFLNVKFCVVFNSGTSALNALMSAYGLQKGDEVLVPSFTFISTVTAPLFVGAKPVFVDIEEESLGMDPMDLARKINSRTRAVIAVHYGGIPCPIADIRKLADKHGLTLIEDAAGAFGSTLGKKKLGTFGDSAVFSFCQNKVISTGEGGCAVTRSRRIYEDLLAIRSHGHRSRESGKEDLYFGFNFRMSNLNAALGISQIQKIATHIRLRKKVATGMMARLKDIPAIHFPENLKNPGNTFQLFPMLVGGSLRDPLMHFLARKGVATKPYFSPIHFSPFFQRKKANRNGSLKVTEAVAQEVLCLPIYPTMTETEMDYVSHTIHRFFQTRAGAA